MLDRDDYMDGVGLFGGLLVSLGLIPQVVKVRLLVRGMARGVIGRLGSENRTYRRHLIRVASYIYRRNVSSGVLCVLFQVDPGAVAGGPGARSDRFLNYTEGNTGNNRIQIK